MNNYFKRWGFRIGHLSIVWYDLAERAIGLEITWKYKGFALGFNGGFKRW